MTSTATKIGRFEYAAPIYAEAGWPVVPVSAGEGGAKGTPMSGLTGWNGVDLAPDQIEVARQDFGNANIAIRCPVGVIGLDVDAYDDKPGAETLAKWNQELGALPPTYVSTSREDGVSGIRWYRVPSDWVGVGAVPGIELIQRHHRFALVAPSLHPSGRRYRWEAQDNFLPAMVNAGYIQVPRVSDLPWLPEAYLAALRSTGSRNGQRAEVTHEDILGLRTSGQPCEVVTGALARYQQMTGAGESCHDSMLKVQMDLLRKGEQGHFGVDVALDQLYDQFEADRGHIRDTIKEWDDAQFTGASKVLAEPSTGKVENYCCQPKADTNGHSPVHPAMGLYGQVSPDGRFKLDATNLSDFTDQVQEVIGTKELSGIFCRTGELVFTPRIGEAGYIPSEEEGVDLGPAQVRTLSSSQLKAMIRNRFDVGRWMEKKDGTGRLWVRIPAPREQIIDAYESARMGDRAPNVRTLVGVTHTPAIRPDGTVLDQPGYDKDTGLLFLPDKGLVVPPVPEQPTVQEIKEAVGLFLTMTAEFPFVTPDHRANWCGLAFTPLMRTLLRPPYPMGIMTAPNPGSGKGFLVGMIRALHGGVLRGELPRDAEELRKAITSTLIDTTAPVVTFDNLTGVIRSSVLEALLTTAEWTDRFLGHNRQVTAPNDRLWLATGNNAMIGGDLARRVVFVEIDPKMPNPHLRTGFRIHPPVWVPQHRGELLAAMLTIIRGWILDGRPTEMARSDDYAIWQGALTGMLHWAGIPGTFGATEISAATADPDADEWHEFLVALHEAFGDEEFTTADVVEALRRGNMGKDVQMSKEDAEAPKVDPTKMPGDLTDKFSRASYGKMSGFSKSLGRWFLNRAGRYAHGWKISRVAEGRVVTWIVDPPGAV